MDSTHLYRALELAMLREGDCFPNPAVGAVLVKNQQVISEGYHFQAGEPHAEANILADMPLEISRGATLYTTLEPCCHLNKRTPPCTNLIIEKKIARVVYGYQDPNPQVAGQGIEKLKQEGVTCEFLPLLVVQKFYQPYHYWTKFQKPWTIAKLALSLDGKVSKKDRKRVFLTHSLLNQRTHHERLKSNAILTTSQTVLTDNPELNVRLLASEPIAKPIYLLDRRGKVDTTHKIFKTAKKLTVFHGEKASSEWKEQAIHAGAKLIQISETEHGLDLPSIWKILAQDGTYKLWVETGPGLLKSAWEQNLIQQLHFYVCATWLGEEGWTPWGKPWDIQKEALSVQVQSYGNQAIFLMEHPTCSQV